jgi:hypothetical protein
MGAGGTADWIDGVPTWSAATVSLPILQAGSVNKHNGRYIYSIRGGGNGSLDIYDIALNTWLSAMYYGNATETFTTGSCSVDIDGAIFLQKDTTGRIFRFDLDRYVLEPYAWLLYPQSTTLAGDKMFIQKYKDGGTTVRFLYTLMHNRTEMFRMLDI